MKKMVGELTKEVETLKADHKDEKGVVSNHYMINDKGMLQFGAGDSIVDSFCVKAGQTLEFNAAATFRH